MKAAYRLLVAGAMAAVLMAPAGLAVTTDGTGTGLSPMLGASTAYAARREGTAQPGGGGVTRPVVPPHTSAKPVQGGASGSGSATDAQCQNMAHMVNVLLDQGQDELNTHGNGQRFNEIMDAAKFVQNTG